MTREELIEKEGEKYSAEKWKHPSSNLSRAHCSLDYMAGINSQLAKDLQELAVIEGKIEVLMWVNLRVCFGDILKSDIYRDIEQLSSTRTELLKQLNFNQ